MRTGRRRGCRPAICRPTERDARASSRTPRPVSSRASLPPSLTRTQFAGVPSRFRYETVTTIVVVGEPESGDDRSVGEPRRPGRCPRRARRRTGASATTAACRDDPCGRSVARRGSTIWVAGVTVGAVSILLARMVSATRGRQWYGGPAGTADRRRAGDRDRPCVARRESVRCGPAGPRGPTGTARFPGSPIDGAARGHRRSTDGGHPAGPRHASAFDRAAARRRPRRARSSSSLGIVMAYVVARDTDAGHDPADRSAEHRPDGDGHPDLGDRAGRAGRVRARSGASRLVRILTDLKARNPPRSTLLRALGFAAGRRRGRPRSDAADGRAVSDVVLGPFGAAVIRELPPAAMTRIREGRWELAYAARLDALENPLERAGRDSDGSAAGSATTTPISWSRSTPRSSAPAGRSPGRRLRGAHAGPAGAVDRRAAAAAQPDRGRRDRVLELVREAAGAEASPTVGRVRVELVGEPGLEPGTSGI